MASVSLTRQHRLHRRTVPRCEHNIVLSAPEFCLLGQDACILCYYICYYYADAVWGTTKTHGEERIGDTFSWCVGTKSWVITGTESYRSILTGANPGEQDRWLIITHLIGRCMTNCCWLHSSIPCNTLNGNRKCTPLSPGSLPLDAFAPWLTAMAPPPSIYSSTISTVSPLSNDLMSRSISASCLSSSSRRRFFISLSTAKLKPW